MAAQDISIVGVENLKIQPHCIALISMMEKGFLTVRGMKMNTNFEERIHVKYFLYKTLSITMTQL